MYGRKIYSLESGVSKTEKNLSSDLYFWLDK